MFPLDSRRRCARYSSLTLAGTQGGRRPEVGPGRLAQLRRARFLAGGPTARAPEKEIPIT